MESWICPKCQHVVMVRSALTITHRCPSNKSQLTNYIKDHNATSN